MPYYFLIIGVLCFSVGLLCYRFPSLIAGYNMMSKEERKKIDIGYVKRTILICLSLLGCLSILFMFLPDRTITHIVWLVLSLSVIGVMLVIVNRKKK